MSLPSQHDDTGPEHSQTTDARVSLLLSDLGNRRIMDDWLSSQYEVLIGDKIPDALSEGTIDLCILDPASFDEYRDLLSDHKTAQEQRIRPYLLVRHDDGPLLDADAQQYIDDVIVLPTTKREFRWRIESLLRLRGLSLQLDEKNKRLEYLMGAAAHDLRNPLSIAQGYTAQLENSTAVDRITAALNRMEHLVESLLTVKRTKQTITKEDLAIVSFTRLVQECWAVVPTKNASLSVADAEVDRIQAAPEPLRQLVENLLHNASDHGGSDVSVCVGMLDSGDGFYVADDGPGIPDEKRDAVFEEGYSTSAGTGLGLAIVKRVCNVHGWQVRIVESHDDGARFEIQGVETVRVEND